MNPALRHRRRLARSASRSGFTLLEVLVAIGIMAVIASIAWATLAGTLRARDYLEEDDDVARSARSTMDHLRRHLSVAFLTSNTSAVNTYRTVFVGKDEDDADRLWFTSLGHRRTYRNSRECDQAEITLWTEVDPDNSDHLVLLMREAGRIDQEPDRGGGVLPLARDVTRFDLRYLDPTANEWREEWDTAGGETPNRLPRMVEVVLALARPDPDGEGEVIESKYVETIVVEMAAPITKSLFSGGGSQ